MSSEVERFIVLRAPDIAFDYEGWWFDRLNFTLSGSAGLPPGEEFELVQTDKSERRDSDGATARVWEVRRRSAG